MLMKKEDIKKILSDAFDAGFQHPLEMMEQNVNMIFKKFKSTCAAVTTNNPDTNSWGWGDYYAALSQPDPWVEKVKK